jgi:hypothetical protein
MLLDVFYDRIQAVITMFGESVTNKRRVSERKLREQGKSPAALSIQMLHRGSWPQRLSVVGSDSRETCNI